MNYISFPGLGIDEFALNKTAFTLFGKPIMWYGVIITFGMILAVMYVLYRAKKNEGISSDDVIDYAIYLILFGVIGARLYYVFTEFSSYKGKDIAQTMLNIIAIWEGGLAIYGGIIAGAIALFIVSYAKKIKATKMLDMAGPAVMIGQIVGRWGNFMNAEAHGGPTDLPWRMGMREAGSTVTEYVHPTFLYESLWNLVGFILINIFYKRKKYDGQIVVMYLTWYGLGRMMIEGLRTDSLYVGDFRISQVVAFLCFFLGLSFLTAMEIVRFRKRRALKALAYKESEETEINEENEITAEAEVETEEAEEVTEEKEPEQTEEAEEVTEEKEPEQTEEEEIFEISESYSDDDEEEE